MTFNSAPPATDAFVAPGCALFSDPSKKAPAAPTAATMYTRENLTVLFKCSHGELGRLLSRKMAPLPVRIDGQILWHVDEVQNSTAQVQRTLERWKVRR